MLFSKSMPQDYREICTLRYIHTYIFRYISMFALVTQSMLFRRFFVATLPATVFNQQQVIFVMN
jgi:hypothetical protein